MKRLHVQASSTDQYPVPQDPTLCRSEYLRHCRSAAPEVFWYSRIAPPVDHPLSGIFPRIFNFRPMLHIKESAPFLLVPGKVLHKRSIAILAGMCTAHIGIDRVTAYRQTRLSHDVLCFHLTNEDSIYYFFHDFCTSNTLLNSSGIS